MEETSSKAIKKTPVPGPASTSFLTGQRDDDKQDGAMDMLDAESPSGDEYASQQSSQSDVQPEEAAGLDEEDGDDNDAGKDAAAHVGHDVLPGSNTQSCGDGMQAPRRSKRKPAPKVTWWERNPTAYVAEVPKGGAPSGWDLSKAPVNAKKARARSDWPLGKASEKEQYLAHKKLGTWPKTRCSNKRKAVKTRYVYDIKHEFEGNMTRYKARLVAQGFNQLPGREYDQTWAPVPSSATKRALIAVAAAKDWEVHHVDVKTAFLNAKMDKEVYIKLLAGAEPGKEDDVRRLNHALYGTEQARRIWGIKLIKALNAIGAVRSKVDSCLYTWSHLVHGLVYILVYVDDRIVAGKGLEGVQMMKTSVSASFDVRDMGEVKDFTGMKVMRDRAAKVITLRNPVHVSSLLEAFQMDKSAPNRTPMVSRAKLCETGENLLPEGIW